MPRPFNRRQARENAAFIRLLAETGNAELAARECGLAPATIKSRRAVNAAFAAEWDAALTAAQAHMAADPKKAARAGKGRWPDGPNAPARFRSGSLKARSLKTGGGEPQITRMKDGRLQLRLARAGGIGFRAEQAFLRALATCGNIAMAARAVGVAPKNISARRRRNPLFKAEMDKARGMASDRLEWAVRERFEQAMDGSGPDDLWADAELPPLPPMTMDQALMLLRLYQRREALGDEWGRYATRKRRGPLSSNEIAIERRIWWITEQAQREAAAARVARGEARARRYEETGNWFLPGEEVPDALAPGGKKAKRSGPGRGPRNKE